MYIVLENIDSFQTFGGGGISKTSPLVHHLLVYCTYCTIYPMFFFVLTVFFFRSLPARFYYIPVMMENLKPTNTEFLYS